MKYRLEPYNGMKTRFICPKCNSKNSFTRYIDTETNNYIDLNVGRCNKEINCGYHKKPKDFFTENNISINSSFLLRNEIIKEKPPDYIDFSILESSLKCYDNNNFIKFLNTIFDSQTVKSLIEKYYIGTSKHWNGATIFWQIDEVFKIRTGKIMLYDSIKGKRIKEPYNHLNWVHKKIKKDDFSLKQTLFGMHLIKDSSEPIAIVESEKTAIICSVYYPNYIWLATGGLNNLNKQLMRIFKNRSVVLFPDLGAFEKWSLKVETFNENGNIKVSDILEKNATETEKQNGFDLADYILKEKDSSK